MAGIHALCETLSLAMTAHEKSALALVRAAVDAVPVLIPWLLAMPAPESDEGNEVSTPAKTCCVPSDARAWTA